MLSVDTETTGLDWYHGAKPYLVTLCDGRELTTYEWDVDPLTREPSVPEEDLDEIEKMIHEADALVLQNTKFDVAALATLRESFAAAWPWCKTEDTLIAGHVLASNQPHDLTSMSYHYLGHSIEALEDAVGEATEKARRLARSHLPNWQIAKSGREDMPSAKGECWKLDMWLPKALCKWAREQLKSWLMENRPGQKMLFEIKPAGVKKKDIPWWWEYAYPFHQWRGVTADYANGDSEATVHLFGRQLSELRRRSYEKIYREQLKQIPILYDMEQKGVTISGARLHEQRERYVAESKECAARCEAVARSYGYDLKMPKGGRSNALNEFVFDVMKLPVVAKTGSGNASMNKAALETYEGNLKENTKPWLFMKNLKAKRSRDTAVSYMDGYSNFWLPVVEVDNDTQERTTGGYARPVEDSRVSTLAGDAKKMSEQTKQRLPSLGGTRDQSLRPMVSVVSTLPTGHGGKTVRQTSSGSDKQRRGLRTDELSMGSTETTIEEHKTKSPALTSRSNGDGSRMVGTNGDQVSNLTDANTPRLVSRKNTDYTLTASQRKIVPGFYRLHPSFNQTGTATLRFSSRNPNTQNISKKENFNLRHAFGPAPGREWWSLDYENIELRIPAYAAPEPTMIELFERPNDPPFFGSYHLMNASLIYPDLFAPLAADKGAFKKKYNSTWYSWCKNFGFAFQYGGGRETCDRAAHKAGAYDAVRSKLPGLTRLTNSKIAFAEKHGHVETMPDSTVDPSRGYPLLCTRTDWGKVLPTVPLSYFVQGTAMWCTRKAMVRVFDYLRAYRDHYMTMQVHDEIDLDFPAGTGEEPWRTNLEKIKEVKRLMERSGEDIGVPLRVSVAYHPDNWGEELAISC